MRPEPCCKANLEQPRQVASKDPVQGERVQVGRKVQGFVAQPPGLEQQVLGQLLGSRPVLAQSCTAQGLLAVGHLQVWVFGEISGTGLGFRV